MSAVFLLQIVASVALLAILAVIFKPLLKGTYRALKMVVKLNRSKEQRVARAHYRNAMILHSMTSSSDSLQPNLVAELRAFSCRS